MPQAFNLLEQGEAVMIGGALSSYAMERKRKSAPIDMAAPKEGVMSMPSGIAKVKNGPQPELALRVHRRDAGSRVPEDPAEAAAAVPRTRTAPMPAGMPKVEVFVPDWANVAEKRNGWVERWDKEMAV